MTTTGPTLKQLAKRVRLHVVYGAKLPWDQQDEWQHNANGYRVTMRYKGRRYSFDYWMGVACRGEPDPETCLDSLLSDAQGGERSFEEFCGDFGYDVDSRKAEKTWRACQKVAENMRRLLGDEFETFLYADRN